VSVDATRPAATLSVGDELVLGQIADTNATWLAERFAACGLFRAEHRTVADDRVAIARAIRELAARHGTLVVTGGLGPTADDLTRVALNAAIDPAEPPLVEDAAARRDLARWFGERGRPMPAMNLVQASRPASARCLANPHGTAPGLAARVGECLVWCLPGPPGEMRPMFEAEIAPVLAAGGRAVVTRSLRAYGLGESAAAERIAALMERGREPSVGTTASGSIVTARIRAEGEPAAATERAESTLRLVEDAWRPYAFGRDGSLAEAVAAELLARGATVSVAESCTGGLVGGALTAVPGSSAFFPGGILAYANEVKIAELAVPAELLARHGAVSGEVARAMAAGVRSRFATSYGLAVTGVAGPGGGTANKPVGLVHLGLADPSGAVASRAFRFPGERSTVRERSVLSILQWLRFALLGRSGEPLLWEAAE